MAATILVLFQGCFSGAFYHPDGILRETPADYHLRFEEIYFASRDGTRLYGWFVPATGKALGTVIYFHGNYGNLTYYFKQVHWLPAQKFNVFTFDYRGYGHSGGRPSNVSYRHSERLYELAKRPKELWLIDGCGHLKVFNEVQSGSDYRQKLVQFFLDHYRESG